MKTEYTQTLAPKPRCNATRRECCNREVDEKKG